MRNTIEVDLSTKDALRAFGEINHGKSIGLKEREIEPLHDGRAFQITADGLPLGMFVNLYVDGTWTSTTNIDLDGE